MSPYIPNIAPINIPTTCILIRIKHGMYMYVSHYIQCLPQSWFRVHPYKSYKSLLLNTSSPQGPTRPHQGLAAGPGSRTWSRPTPATAAPWCVARDRQWSCRMTTSALPEMAGDSWDPEKWPQTVSACVCVWGQCMKLLRMMSMRMMKKKKN